MIPTYYVYKLFQEHLKHVKCYPRADIFTHVMHVTNIMSGVWGAEYTKPDISVTSEMLSSLREGHCCPFSRNKRICGQIGQVKVMTIMITVEFNTSMRQAGSDYESSNWLISGEISAAGCISLTLAYQADKPA